MKAITINNDNEHQSIEQHVKNSELYKNVNTFDYKLNDKTAKAKLLKAAKRQPIDMEENSTSSNLVFSAGAWIHAVLPSVRYWSEVKESKTCRIGDYEVEIGGIKENKETQGKHVNTQIVFLANRNKIVCHMYNTTQLILINGHGYQKFIDVFLKPFLTAKINECIPEIEEFNDQVGIKLGPKTIRRSVVKLKRGSAFPCPNCDFSAKSIPALRKHKKDEHILSLNISDKLAQQKQSTRNNSLTEKLMLEDVSLMDLSQEVQENLKEDTHKFTCDPCNFATKSKGEINDHVKKQHSSEEIEEVKYLCTKCGKEFVNVEEYENHEEVHFKTKQKETEISEIQNLIYIAILENELEVADTFKKHKSINIDVEKTGENNINWEKCEKPLNMNIQIKKHLENEHKEYPAITCNKCDESFQNTSELCDHMMSYHVGKPMEFPIPPVTTEKELLTAIINQNKEILEAFVDFREGVKGVIGKLIEELEENTNSIRKETAVNQKQTQELICKLEDKIENKISPSISSSNTSSVKLKSPVTKAPIPSIFVANKDVDKELKSTKVIKHKKPHVLFVGDPVAQHNNFRKLEIATNTTMKTAKAYSSVKDKTARYPEQNITDVTKDELNKRPYDYLVLAAPSVDISNLETADLKPSDNTDDLKEKVGLSCQNMIKVAEDSLKNNMQLKKVTILNHAPRFDHRDIDPMGLKPNLAIFANNYLMELWLYSPLKNKIHLGTHNLDYGVHMHSKLSREEYMKSVQNILLSSFEITSTVPPNIKHSDDNHTRCPQAMFLAGQRYQDRWQHVTRKERQYDNRTQFTEQQPRVNPTWQRTYSSVAAAPVKIQNRFSILGN